jgi:hypothetical protein
VSHTECGKLFDAGRAAIGQSGLATWKDGAFHPCGCESDFEKYWEQHFHPEFGRYMAWVMFSVGAENIAKAAFVCNGLLKSKLRDAGYSPHPSDDLGLWLKSIVNAPLDQLSIYEADIPGRAVVYEYRTLGTHLGLREKKKGKPSTFDRLVDKHPAIAGTSKEDVLWASYRYLTDVIRNRDTHTYVKEVRKSNFPLVNILFVPSFNVLVSTMQARSHPF